MVFSKQHKGAHRLYRVPAKAEQIHENAWVLLVKRLKNLKPAGAEIGEHTEHWEKTFKGFP
ncbi:hypothetical protein CSQ88_04995 [Iodobacter sp. BJB302]|nr:hypothetical protein CSQ88_04995 [Iodobacter sp. BJB302]